MRKWVGDDLSCFAILIFCHRRLRRADDNLGCFAILVFYHRRPRPADDNLGCFAILVFYHRRPRPADANGVSKRVIHRWQRRASHGQWARRFMHVWSKLFMAFWYGWTAAHFRIQTKSIIHSATFALGCRGPGFEFRSPTLLVLPLPFCSSLELT